MSTTYPPHVGNPSRTSSIVTTATDVLIDLNGYDFDDGFGELLHVARRANVSLPALARALVELAGSIPYPNESEATRVADEVWGRHFLMAGD